jgi:hypothetical protein
MYIYVFGLLLYEYDFKGNKFQFSLIFMFSWIILCVIGRTLPEGERWVVFVTGHSVHEEAA